MLCVIVEVPAPGLDPGQLRHVIRQPVNKQLRLHVWHHQQPRWSTSWSCCAFDLDPPVTSLPFICHAGLVYKQPSPFTSASYCATQSAAHECNMSQPSLRCITLHTHRVAASSSLRLILLMAYFGYWSTLFDARRLSQLFQPFVTSTQSSPLDAS